MNEVTFTAASHVELAFATAFTISARKRYQWDFRPGKPPRQRWPWRWFTALRPYLRRFA
jgi:hypothetical protein